MSANWNNNLHWNIVDTHGTDGMLHYGRVIDCAEQGLMIDFGDGESPRPVPFGRIHCCKLKEFQDGAYSDSTTDNLPVDVLLRLRRDQPVKWYPGVLLTGNFDRFGSFALVRITTPDGTLALVVAPGNRIRSAQGHGQLLEKGQFVKEEIQLPSGVPSGLPSPSPYETPPADQYLVDRFNSNCSEQCMVATHIDGGVLHVLKITDQFPSQFDRYRSSGPKLEGNMYILLRMLGAAPQSQRKRPADEEDAITKQGRSHSCATPSLDPPTFQSSASNPAAAVIPQLHSPVTVWPACQPTPAATTSALSLHPSNTSNPSTAGSMALKEVPNHVLAEVFECVDGVPQTLLRRVSSRWNGILTSRHMSRRFRVPEESRLFEPISARICLLKRWTAHTKIIVYSAIASTAPICDTDVGDRSAEEKHCGSLLCAGRFFRCIFQEKQLPRLDTLVLDNLAWEWPGRPMRRSFSHFVDHILNELNYFASVCQRLVVKKVSVLLSGHKIPVVVRLNNLRIEGTVLLDTLWGLMDNSQAPLNREDVACWAEWIGSNSNNHWPGQLIEILNERQSADPRDSNPFRGKEWTRDDLAHLRLEKLNRITLHSLVKACCYKKLVL